MDVTIVTTNEGLELKAKMEQGATLEITRIAAATGKSENLEGFTGIENLTEINDIRKELKITGKERRGTRSIIYAVLENKGLLTGFDLKIIGIYANDPDKGEILYRVARLEHGYPISAEKDFPNFSIDCTFTDTVYNASEVHVVVDPAGMVTASQFEYVSNLAHEAFDTSHEALSHTKGLYSYKPINSRTRPPWKATYGIGDAGTFSATLEAMPYTGTAEVSISDDGAEYDVNMSTDGENAPDGAIIIKKYN